MSRMSEAEYQAMLLRRQTTDAGARVAKRVQTHPEDELQRDVCEFWSASWPLTWAKTFHTPNGLAAKNQKLAAIFAGLGVKPGVFDLVCIARRGPFTGFVLELKSRSGSVSDTQNDWFERFASEGWCCAFAFAFAPAIAALRQYHALPSHEEYLTMTTPTPKKPNRKRTPPAPRETLQLPRNRRIKNVPVVPRDRPLVTRQ
jgi:hypothetical protein